MEGRPYICSNYYMLHMTNGLLVVTVCPYRHTRSKRHRNGDQITSFESLNPVFLIPGVLDTWTNTFSFFLELSWVWLQSLSSERSLINTLPFAIPSSAYMCLTIPGTCLFICSTEWMDRLTVCSVMFRSLIKVQFSEIWVCSFSYIPACSAVITSKTFTKSVV